jgi:hypothetical protein
MNDAERQRIQRDARNAVAALALWTLALVILALLVVMG